MARIPAPIAEEAWLAPPVDCEFPVALALADGAVAEVPAEPAVPVCTGVFPPVVVAVKQSGRRVAVRHAVESKCP